MKHIIRFYQSQRQSCGICRTLLARTTKHLGRRGMQMTSSPLRLRQIACSGHMEHVPDPDASQRSAMSTQCAGPPTPGKARFAAAHGARLAGLEHHTLCFSLCLSEIQDIARVITAGYVRRTACPF